MKIWMLILCLSLSFPASHAGETALLDAFMQELKSKEDLESLRKKCLSLNGKAVPTLITVMKEERFPDKNRWMATFLLGKIMGRKASGFISQFIFHPLWMLRLAGLKTLLALKERGEGEKYAQALRDQSLFVRQQALENIRSLNLREFAPYVWEMIFDEKNYQSIGNNLVRLPILSQAIRTLGDLNYQNVTDALFKMISKKEYDNLVYDIDYGLSKIFHVESPVGGKETKKDFWIKFSQQRRY